MARESTQHKLDRVRPPRVHITYDVETEGGVEAERTYDGRKIRWTQESRQALKSIEDKYQRRRDKARIEKAARIQKLDPIPFELAQRFGKKVEVKIQTAMLNGHCDTICGNEERAYPTLGKASHVECAKALQNFYRGTDLDVRWSDPNGRSAMLGQFSL